MTGRMGPLLGRLGAVALLAAPLAACDRDGAGPELDGRSVCTIDRTAPLASNRVPGMTPASLGVLGLGPVPDRFTSELSVAGRYAYTGTWGARAGRRGNVLHVWEVSGSTPALVNTITIAPDTVTTLGDVQLSDDRRHLFVATEPVGSLRVFDLADPAAPRLVSVFRPSTPGGGLPSGVHTAEIARVDGDLYGFLSINLGSTPSRLVIVDLTDPARPAELLSQPMGHPFIHDVFVRDGLLFTALWNDGLTIWDLGACGRGSVRAPARVSTIRTRGEQVHNIWWYRAPNGSRRYLLVGQEGQGVIGSTSSGDVHVVDISDPLDPVEVAFYHVDGAGTHNFSMDESRGLLFAAYYNGGVRALDVRGDLGACGAAERAPDGRCDLGLMGREVARWLTGPGQASYVWGVQWVDGQNELYASDMVAGLYRLDTSGLPR